MCSVGLSFTRVQKLIFSVAFEILLADSIFSLFLSWFLTSGNLRVFNGYLEGIRVLRVLSPH